MTLLPEKNICMNKIEGGRAGRNPCIIIIIIIISESMCYRIKRQQHLFLQWLISFLMVCTFLLPSVLLFQADVVIV